MPLRGYAFVRAASPDPQVVDRGAKSMALAATAFSSGADDDDDLLGTIC